MAERNMIIALVLSVIWSGLGIIYAGDVQKGIILAVIGFILRKKANENNK